MAYLMAPETLDVKGTARATAAARRANPGHGRRPSLPAVDAAGIPGPARRSLRLGILDGEPAAQAVCASRQSRLVRWPGSFTACSARRATASRAARQAIGGWRCHQHRSYFAIRLPHDWWIWGPDIQLAGNLDDAQRDYFDLISEQTSRGTSDHLPRGAELAAQELRQPHEISMLARKHGATVCAVLAGDWHHYSRYAEAGRGTLRPSACSSSPVAAVARLRTRHTRSTPSSTCNGRRSRHHPRAVPIPGTRSISTAWRRTSSRRATTSTSP